MFGRTIAIRLWAVGTTACLAASAGVTLGAEDSASTSRQAAKILEATGVEGGLVVHLGCGDGELTAALRADERFLVHGLDADAENVRRAREKLAARGLYGKVAVDRLEGGRLPYVDGLVKLLVAEELGGVAMDEVLRVLAPGGVAYVADGDGWKKTVKSRPEEIDEWTHFLYDASNNAVSGDMIVGPPRQLQWIGGQTWARSHDHLASVSAVVSAGGRVFSIEDEAPIAAVIIEPKWSLIARDAFSGVVLWRRPIASWQWHLRGFRSGPSEIARRLVAVGDRVYVTLGYDAPISELDAATGKTLRTYDATANSQEFIYQDGTLLAVVGDRAAQEIVRQAERRGQKPGLSDVRPQRPAYPERPPRKQVVAVDTQSGRLLWKKGDARTDELMPTTLATAEGRVFFQNTHEIVCLDGNSGEELWQAARSVSRNRPTWSAPTLVVYDGVVLSGDRAVAEKPQDAAPGRDVQWTVSSTGGQAPVGELIGFSAADGKRLWSTKCRECYNSPADVLVADGLVWTGSIVRASDPGVLEGLDPKTGDVRRTRPADKEFFSPGMGHGRCYRNKATERYLVFGRSGVEFIDVATGGVVPNHWTRGTCQYGVMPCNGLLYAPQHSCACFIDSKLNGFHCLAPKRPSQSLPNPDEDRLQRGPAYTQIINPISQIINSTDWPTYRHDPARSGRTASPLPEKLQPAWQTDLGGKLSSVVVADGKLLVAQINAHCIHALNASDGKPLWSYTTGGRVDSPPTVWQGRVLFGSADGWVYCLRAKDGALAWRFRAAPADRRIVSYGQLESAWPVHGSVLVRDGVVCCVAGRSSYLDGGIRLLRLDAASGRKLSETTLDYRDPETGFQRKEVVRGTDMPGALPDVLSCDGDSIYMRHTRFDASGQPQPQDVPHLFSPAGFLDDTWWHRTYWLVGTAMGNNYGGWPGAGMRAPSGRLLSVGEESIYGFGRNQYIHHGAHVGIDGATVFHFNPGRDAERRHTHYRAFAVERTAAAGKKTYRWTQQLPIVARAMVAASETLLLAGPPHFLTADDPAGAIEGTQGGTLIVLSAANGKMLAERPLKSPPVHDGMAVANGRVYMATVDGKVLCFGGK